MEIAVIGGGGHSKVVQDIVHADGIHAVKAVLDDKYTDMRMDNGIYTGPISEARRLLTMLPSIKFVAAIGHNETRKSVVAKLGLPDEHYAALVHPTAVISPSAMIGPGTVVMPNAVINADARIGSHAIINTGAVIEHDNRIGDYAHACPRAVLTGTVIVEEGALIGAGAAVVPGTCIGQWAVIGAGASVIGDIPEYCTAVGTPARVIHRSEGGMPIRGVL
ncbi:acetyltransferase [Ferviditalea candida]|uniref:Acetyltransferase n=1 Tax=Ferviditalea candida TaxID=3108399 RepID=A0ABU5ZG08_9BACL|nr:acetyltransferase [Paenibacillaceae bacterium T2]